MNKLFEQYDLKDLSKLESEHIKNHGCTADCPMLAVIIKSKQAVRWAELWNQEERRGEKGLLPILFRP